MSTLESWEARADTGFSTTRLGMLLFLAAEAMFMGAVYSSYAFLRASAAEWPGGQVVHGMLHGLAAVGLGLGAWLLVARRSAALGCIGAGLLVLVISVGLGQGENAAAASTAHALRALFTELGVLHVGTALGLGLWFTFVNRGMLVAAPERLRERVACLRLWVIFLAVTAAISAGMLVL